MWVDSLKEMKKRSGLTTAQIAEGSGIPEPTPEKLFAGKTKNPKLPTMQKLVHFLGYTLDDLEDINKETTDTSVGGCEMDRRIILLTQKLSDKEKEAFLAQLEVLTKDR